MVTKPRKIGPKWPDPKVFPWKNAKMCFSPRGSILCFEGRILLSIQLGLAVRIFWSDLGKFPNRLLGRFWGDILARGRFCGEKWFRKKLFCGGMILWWDFRGVPPAQMNSMVPRTHMGRPLCPQTP